MIKLDSFEVNADNVKKVINRFTSQELPRLEKLWAYYSSNNNILNRISDGDKPNNKLACAYAKYITKMQVGYFMGKGIKHKSSDEEYLEEYNKILNDNFIDDINFEMAKDCSIYGHAVEIIYQNEKAQTKKNYKKEIKNFSKNY